MNFLGHLYLTHTADAPLQVGNFLADSVKGDPYRRLPLRIADGVMLHRAIDTYTDSHPEVEHMVALLHARVGRVAPVAVDMVMDHILSRNWALWHPDPLPEWAAQKYALLGANSRHFPERVGSFFVHMVQHDWLSAYGTDKGLRRSLEGLSSRLSFQSDLVLAADCYAQHREVMDACFGRFMTDVTGHVKAHSLFGACISTNRVSV
jgi:acyl carrier protein phosphodiesterase